MWNSEMTVNSNCLEVTIAKFRHFPTQGVGNDEKLLYWNIINYDGILILLGMLKKALSYDIRLSDNGEVPQLVDHLSPT